VEGFEDTVDRTRGEKGHHIFANLRISVFRIGSNIIHNLLDIPLTCFGRSIYAWKRFMVVSNRIALKSGFDSIKSKIESLRDICDRNATFAHSNN
jgi:hypothetical protein